MDFSIERISKTFKKSVEILLGQLFASAAVSGHRARRSGRRPCGSRRTSCRSRLDRRMMLRRRRRQRRRSVMMLRRRSRSVYRFMVMVRRRRSRSHSAKSETGSQYNSSKNSFKPFIQSSRRYRNKNHCSWWRCCSKLSFTFNVSRENRFTLYFPSTKALYRQRCYDCWCWLPFLKTWRN